LVTKLQEDIEKYVDYSFENYEPKKVTDHKVIHDTILGTNIFKPYEVALIDIPLIQRLRRISQVGCATLVFPSSNHSRFEHTLGVTILAGHLAKALAKKIEENQGKNELYDKVGFFDENYIKHVRIAALLHDCGHGPLSHLSEKIFDHCEDIKEEKIKNKKFFQSQPSGHEILSYLIVTSKAFKDYFDKNIKQEYDTEVDLELIGEMIIGYKRSPEKYFLIEIINGSFDADKLDYIQRDSHFTGIKMSLDITRLFYTVDIVEDDEGNIRLTSGMNGVTALEQIVFNKMLLRNTVYHHQKIRAAECLIKSILMQIKKDNQEISNRKLLSACDYLYLTDDDIFQIDRNIENKRISILSYNYLNRNLPKRAFAITSEAFKIEAGKKRKKVLYKAMNLFEEYPELTVEDIIQLIATEIMKAGKKIDPNDIWIDLPDSKKFKEGECPVKNYDGNCIRLRKIFPIDDWTTSFNERKWIGYVYTFPEHSEDVYNASKIVFSELLKVEFNDLSQKVCKIINDQN